MKKQAKTMILACTVAVAVAGLAACHKKDNSNVAQPMAQQNSGQMDNSNATSDQPTDTSNSNSQ